MARRAVYVVSCCCRRFLFIFVVGVSDSTLDVRTPRRPIVHAYAHDADELPQTSSGPTVVVIVALMLFLLLFDCLSIGMPPCLLDMPPIKSSITRTLFKTEQLSPQLNNSSTTCRSYDSVVAADGDDGDGILDMNLQ